MKKQHKEDVIYLIFCISIYLTSASICIYNDLRNKQETATIFSGFALIPAVNTVMATIALGEITFDKLHNILDKEGEIHEINTK